MALATACADNYAMNFSENQHGGAVLDKLRAQRDNERFCDIVLHVNGKKFTAHRNILAACSPYFDSIFKLQQIDNNELSVSCENLDAFQSLLNYMYTGCVVIDRNNVSELLKLAHHFLVLKLKNYCAEYLDRYLDSANCLNIRELGEKYNMPALMKNATHYLQANLSSVLHQSEVLSLPVDRLSFLSDKSIDPLPEIVFKFICCWVKQDVNARVGNMKELLAHVTWQSMDRDDLLTMVENEALIQENQQCLMIVIDVLKVENFHSANVSKYESKFSNVREGTNDDDDNDSVLSLAIAAAIEDDAESIEPKFSNFDKIPVSPLCIDQESSCSDNSFSNQTDFSSAKSDSTDDIGGKQNFCQENLPIKMRITKSVMQTAQQLEWNSFGQHNLPKQAENLMIPRIPSVVPANINSAGESDEDESSIQSPSCSSEESEASPQPRIRNSAGSAKCPQCSYIVHNHSRLEQHIRKAHSKNVTYRCNFCNFYSKWNREYYTHMKTHFSGPPFQCDVCQYTCERIQPILSHRMKHTNEKPWQCSQCAYRCRTKNNLIAHTRSHTGEKPFECSHCGRCFAIKSTLDQHLVTHSDVRPYLCDTCGFSTKYQSHLIAHKRIHTGDVYPCHYPNCTYSSPKKSQLKAHMRTHMAVRSHMCNLCGRSFVEKSHLVRHERIHLTVKPFKCDVCEYGSSRRDKLKEHKQKHHNDKILAGKSGRSRKSIGRPSTCLSRKTKPQSALTNSFTDTSRLGTTAIHPSQTTAVKAFPPLDGSTLSLSRNLVVDPQILLPNNTQPAGSQAATALNDFANINGFMNLF